MPPFIQQFTKSSLFFHKISSLGHFSSHIFTCYLFWSLNNADDLESYANDNTPYAANGLNDTHRFHCIRFHITARKQIMRRSPAILWQKSIQYNSFKYWGNFAKHLNPRMRITFLSIEGKITFRKWPCGFQFWNL